MRGCWAAMVCSAGLRELLFDGAFVEDSILSWIARNSSKPGRLAGEETWVLHGSPEWSDQHIDEPPDSVLPEMLDAFHKATGVPVLPYTFATCHRWRYALPPDPLADRCLFDSTQLLGACGDWCLGPRVEAAWLSGARLAERILEH